MSPLPGLPGWDAPPPVYPFGFKPSTPTTVDDTVRAFANEVLDIEAEPIILSVLVDSESEPLECFRNVERKIKLAGGSRRYGWVIWKHGASMIEGEFHSVWISPDGSLVDVTPHDDEQKIVFVPDKSIKWATEAPTNRRRALGTDEATIRKMKQLEARDAERKAYYADPPSYVRVVEKPLSRTIVGRNEPCRCGSGLKYKKCCSRRE